MVTFRNNNNRRNNFRRNERNFKSNGDRNKFSSNFSNNDSFQRKMPGRNNHNASKLIEKYSNLAREALSGGDKILSENYFQHADHFTRIMNEQENFKKTRHISSSEDNKDLNNADKIDKEIKKEVEESKVVEKKKEAETEAKITVVK